VVNIDQRTNFSRAKVNQSEPVSGGELGARLKKGVRTCPALTHCQLARRLAPIERPRCPHVQTRNILAGIAPAPAGHELRTFECPKCDRAQRTLVINDPMSGDARGWLAGELKSPD
jgi:hypothetical protein